jgi:hypothetical protein
VVSKRIGCRSTPRNSAINGASAASGPPALPLVIRAIASAWASLARSSMTSPTVQPPAAITACDLPNSVNVTPLMSTAPNRPVPMRYVITNVQKPSVARAAALLVMQGHRYAQLHASANSPSIDHAVLMASP